MKLEVTITGDNMRPIDFVISSDADDSIEKGLLMQRAIEKIKGLCASRKLREGIVELQTIFVTNEDEYVDSDTYLCVAKKNTVQALL